MKFTTHVRAKHKYLIGLHYRIFSDWYLTANQSKSKAIKQFNNILSYDYLSW